ncbi:TPA: hypothetical protein HA361_05460 [Candidatus Woesearchaeota archaeon]|nr:hypothetical protein [Candidatus Woesearchaeota archaeon]HII68306.1 hypothetical protein [Candidatus Woesearchaeota archaeon]
MAQRKPAKKAEPQDEVLFVEIDRPVELRKQVLGCLKDILDSMEKFEKFKVSRAKRIEAVESLKRNASEISRLIAKLKSTLPKTQFKAVVPKKKKEKPQKEVPKEKQAPRPKSEIEEIEAELADIEKKLGQIG